MPNTVGAESPFFSPDGLWIGYFSFDAIYKVRVDGGAPRQVSGAAIISGASWGIGDTIIVGQKSSGLLKLSAEDGAAEAVTHHSPEKGEQDHTLPQILPDGENVLFTVETNDRPKVAVASVENGRYRILFDGSNPRYLATGHLVYTQASTLFAVPFDLESSETSGNPVPVLEGILCVLWANVVTAYFTVSETGTLVYIPGDQLTVQYDSQLVWVDRNGRREPLTETANDYLYPRLSPDGRQVAVSQQAEDRDIWLLDLERRSWMRCTFEGTEFVSVWTPGGERLTYHSDHADQGLFWKVVDASGPEALSIRPYLQFPGGWSPDANYLAFTEVAPETKGDIWILPRDGGEPTPFANTSFDERAPAFSPDGQFIAYVSDESGRDEVHVQPFPGPGRKVAFSTGGGTEPLWNPNGKEVFYRRGDELLVVDIELSPELRLGLPRVLFRGRFGSTRAGPPNYDVSRDGRRFLMVEVEDPVPIRINVVLNWHQELKRRVPTD